MAKKKKTPQLDAFAKAARDTAGLTPETVYEVKKKTPDVLPEIELDNKLACGFSMREIAQMKKSGMKRPDAIPSGDWNGPLKFTHRHMLICHLSALGYKGKDIAAATNLSEQRISDLLNRPEFSAQVKIIREVEMQGVGTAQKIKQLASQATRVYEDILHSPMAKLSLKQKTAQDVLDRELGKPLQKIENTGSMLKDFYQLMKARVPQAIEVQQVVLPVQERNGDIQDAIEVPKVEEKKIIDADKWFEENNV